MKNKSKILTTEMPINVMVLFLLPTAYCLLTTVFLTAAGRKYGGKSNDKKPRFQLGIGALSLYF